MDLTVGFVAFGPPLSAEDWLRENVVKPLAKRAYPDMVCPACGSELKHVGGKARCTRQSCMYFESCSDGGCGL